MNVTRLMYAFGLILALPCGSAVAADAAAPSEARIVTYQPGMSAAALRSRPGTDYVRLPSGRLVQLADIRRLKEISRQIRTAQMKVLPPPLLARPAALGTLVANGTDLRDALLRPDTDTIQLPSGKRLTVGQLKFLREQVEKQAGRSLSAPATGNTQAIKVDAKTDWKRILQMPDATVVEAPGGTRVTVEAIKQALRDEGARP